MKHSKMPALLSFMLTLIVAAVIGAQIYGGESVNESYMTGQLVTGWMLSLTYWFGTNRSSADKDDKLKSIDKTP